MTIRPLLTLSVALLLIGCGQDTPQKQAVNVGPAKEVASAPDPLPTPDEPVPPATVDQPTTPVADPASDEPATPSEPVEAAEPSPSIANVDTSRLNLPTESADVPRNLQEITELSLDDDDQAITKIAALLTHENAAVRRKAAEALRGMGTPYWRKETPIPDLDSYIAVLCQITRDPDVDARAAGFHALQHLGAEAQPALPYLLAGLSDESANIRMTAARTLQDIGPAAADIVPDMVRLRSASLKEAASLGEYDGKTYQWKGIANACAVALAGIGGPKARTIVPDLKRQVLEGNRADLEAESLGRFGEADFLISLVGHEKQITRQAAANGLAFVRPTTDRVVGALAKLTTDEEQQVRMTAIEAFGKCDPKLPSAVPVLVRAFDDEYEYAGRAAQRIVSTYEGAGAARLLALVRKMIKLDRDDFGQVYYYVDDKVENIPPLLEIMADASQPADIRAGAGFLLFQFDDDELEPHAAEILAIYRDSTATPEARMYANLCLASIDEEDFDGSLAAEVLKSSMISFAVIDTAENLYTDASDEAYEPLLALLDHEDPELVTAAASSLLRFDDQGETTLSKLLALSETASDIDVLTQVAYSIGHFGTGSKPAEAALVKLCRHEDGDVQSAAANGLGDMGLTTPEAVTALRELLKDEYTWWEAANALEEAGEVAREAIPDLLALLDKEDAPVPQAIYALAAMGESAVEPALDKILSIAESEDEDHRYAVAYAIDSFPEQKTKVEPVLIKLLGDEDDDVVEAACESAANLKYAGSVPALVKVLQSETHESYTIRLALDALHAIGPDAKEAVSAVKHLAESEVDQYVRERAGEVLAKIAPNDPGLMATRLMTIEPYDDDARRIVSQLGDAALPSLEKLLQSNNGEDRERGMGLMAFLPMTDAVRAAFGRALNSESEATRNSAAIAVSRAGLGYNERVIGLLISALADDDLRYEAENVLSNGGVPLLRPLADAVVDESRSIESRRAAARFLADHGHSAIWIIPQLEKATAADDADLAILSAAAMARLRSDKAPVDLLLSALDKEVEEETLQRAINALSNNAAVNESPAAIDRLIETLNHDDESIASYARYALDDQKLTDAQVAKIAELLTDEEAVEKGYPAQEAAMLMGKAGEAGAAHLPRVVELFRNASSNDVYAYENAFTSFGTLAVPSLLELIGDPKLGKEHRTRAVSALNSIGYEHGIEAKQVAGLLTHDELAVRVAAAAALTAAEAEASTVLPALLEGIQSGDRNVANMAFNAIAKLGPQPTAVPVYRKLLADEDFEQHYHVHHLLTQLGPDVEPLIPDLIATLAKPDPDDNFQYDRQNVENVLSQIDSSQVPKLVEALQHESHQVRYHVLGALRIHDPEATKGAADAIAALIDDPNSDVAMQAAITLMRIAPREEAVPKVVEALELTEDDSIYVYDLRDNAMSALQEASSKSGELVRPLVPRIATMLETESDKYRLLYTLGALKETAKEALPALITTLQNDRQIRWQTLNAIDQIGPTPEALAAVLEIVREGDGQNMARAVDVLDKHGEAASQAFDLLMPKLREPYQRYHAVVALGELESQAERVTPLLDKALRSGDAELIAAAIQAVWSLKEKAAPLTPALLTLFRSEDHRVNAIRAIGMLGESGAGAVPSLRAGLKHADRDVRVASASSLGSIGSASAPAVPELIAMLDDVEDGAGAAARALGSIGDPAKEAIPRMIELLDDDRLQYSMVDSLAEFGPAASAALPKLRELEAAKSGWRKDSITQAIAKIEGKAENEEE